MIRHNIKHEDGSVLVEGIAVLLIFTILSLAMAGTVILSNGIMTKSRKIKKDMYSNQLMAEQKEDPESTEEITLIFTLENITLEHGSQVFVTASELTYGDGLSRLSLVLPIENDKETEDNNEDVELE